MNTSTANRQGMLLVDYETGRVLRADDEVVISEKVAFSHPFMWQNGPTWFAGPEAKRAARAHAAGLSTRRLDTVEYEMTRNSAGSMTLQKREDA
jgi:hypothetical protein